jgi:hypothetical protein
MVARLQAVGWPLSEIDRTSTDRGFNGLRTHLCDLCIATEITPEHAQTISAAVTTFYARASRAKEDVHPHRSVDERRAKTIGQSSSVMIDSHDLIPSIPPADVGMPMPTPPNMPPNMPPKLTPERAHDSALSTELPSMMPPAPLPLLEDM